MTIQHWLHAATEQLQTADITTARLDALVLLADALHRDKAWVLAHDEQELTSEQLKNLSINLDQRSKRYPLSYIRGKQEFYGRDFIVTPATLIPRPETEGLVTALLDLKLATGDTVLDIGTGSGALAITIALERPDLKVFATDVNAEALEVARSNAKRLHAAVTLQKRDLLSSPVVTYPRCIVANLPYVDHAWQLSPEIAYEPDAALYAADKGLALIKQLIRQAALIQKPGAYLLLEADPRQHESISAFARQHGYKMLQNNNFAITLQK